MAAAAGHGMNPASYNGNIARGVVGVGNSINARVLLAGSDIRLALRTRTSLADLTVERGADNPHIKSRFVSGSMKQMARLCDNVVTAGVSGANLLANFTSGATAVRLLVGTEGAGERAASAVPGGEVLIAIKRSYDSVRSTVAQEITSVANLGGNYVQKVVTLSNGADAGEVIGDVCDTVASAIKIPLQIQKTPSFLDFVPCGPRAIKAVFRSPH